jgi:signal transduction histidine kinase
MTPPAALSLAAVSHDLKDPLAAIEVALDFALEQEWASDATPGAGTLSLVRRQLTAAHRAAQRMRRLIVSTLDRGTAEDAPETRTPTPVVAAELVTDVVELYGGVARTREVTLSAELAADLPPLLVRADPILRALGNLLGNAVKFTPRGGRVAVRAAASAGAVTLTVADTGPGLPEEALGHVFRRFWQAPETAHLGTGAGLLIVRMLVEDEGGTVGVRATQGRGAEFWMTLPARGS